VGNSTVTDENNGNSKTMIKSNKQPASANSNDAGWPSATVQYSEQWSNCNSKITEYLSSNNQQLNWWWQQKQQQQQQLGQQHSEGGSNGNSKIKSKSNNQQASTSSTELVALLTTAQHSNDNSKNWQELNQNDSTNNESALTRQSKNKECWVARKQQQWRTKDKR